MKGYTFLMKGTIMQFINTIKEKFNNTKEWCIEHKELLLTDAAILAGCAGAIGVAVAVSKNEDILDLYKAGLVTDDELYPEVVDEIHKMMNEE